MLTHALWADELDAAEQASLDPGVPEDLDLRPDILVVGGGMLGIATALACRRAGLGRVVVVEAVRIGAGPSGSAAGLLIPEAHVGLDPAHAVRLGRSGLEMWRELDGISPGIELTDLDVVSLQTLSERFGTDPPQAAEALDPDDVAALVPGLAHRTDGILLRGQARLNPLKALSAMTRALDAVMTGVELISVQLAGERVRAVRTSAHTFEPGAVIFCTGSPPQFFGPEVKLQASLIRGHLFVTEPAPFRLPGLVDPVCTQVSDGRLLVGGSLDVGGTSPEVDASIIEALREALVVALPWAEPLSISHAWCCFRPAHPDYLPVVDRVPGVVNAWFTSGHYRTGILNAPAVAKELARWVVDGKASADFAAFGAHRLVGVKPE